VELVQKFVDLIRNFLMNETLPKSLKLFNQLESFSGQFFGETFK
jgi:hypothetical protein